MTQMRYMGGPIFRSSCAGLTRASIFFRKRMDCRVKPGNDGGNAATGVDR